MNSCKVEEMFEKGGLMLVDKTCFIAALKMIYKYSDDLENIIQNLAPNHPVTKEIKSQKFYIDATLNLFEKSMSMTIVDAIKRDEKKEITN